MARYGKSILENVSNDDTIVSVATDATRNNVPEDDYVASVDFEAK